MFKSLSPATLGVTGHESEIIELALTYGFGGVDLEIVEFAARAAAKGMPYARRLLDSAKIKSAFFELPITWDVDDADFQVGLEKLGEYAAVAAEVGCIRCTATIEPAGDKRPLHENFEFHKRRFADIGDVLQPHGLSVGLGFRAAADLRQGQAFQFIHDVDALLMLVNMVARDNVGVILDTWNFHLGNGTLDQIRRLDPSKIVMVQLAELPEGVPKEELTEKDRMQPRVEGEIGLPAILTALAGMGYDGPVTPMPARGAVSSRRRDQIVRETVDALNDVWAAAGLGGTRTTPAKAEPEVKEAKEEKPEAEQPEAGVATA